MNFGVFLVASSSSFSFGLASVDEGSDGGSLFFGASATVAVVDGVAAPNEKRDGVALDPL